MSISTHKDIVLQRWYQELWDKWNLAIADDLFTADYRLHLSGVPAPADKETAGQAA